MEEHGVISGGGRGNPDAGKGKDWERMEALTAVPSELKE